MSSAAEALARDAKGSSSGLWQGDAGEALSVLLAELIGAGHGLTLAAADYPPFYRSLLAGQVVRPRAALHPRLFIWGPLEARLQQPDRGDPGQPQRRCVAEPARGGPLAQPADAREARAQSAGAPHRPCRPRFRPGARRAARSISPARGKVDGVPTVPSRWLQRLLALVKAAGLEHKIEAEQPWAQWARERDHAPSFEPVQAPEPRPPLEARPKQTERDPDRAVDRQPLRDLRPIRPETREDERARRRA